MSRPGKIARLPHTVRDTLNLRLHDGEQGPELLAWLNAEPAVQAVLAAHFNGQPINAQNLSEWRRGGYAVWCEQEQVLALAERLHEHQAELDAVLGEERLAECLAQSSLLALMRQLNATWRLETEPERLHAVLAIVNAVSRVQRTQLEVARDRREHPKPKRPTREAEREEDAPILPPPVAKARPTPLPSKSEPVSAEDERKIAAAWDAAMKLAKGMPGKPAAGVASYLPKLPAALQAA